jgi:hypothetical protein
MTASFEVTDGTLKQALLTHFIERIETEPALMEQLLVDGVSPSLIDHLRYHATPFEVRRAVSFKSNVFKLQLDDHALMASLETTTRVKRDEQIKEYLASNGASTEQLASWFTMSKAEANALRDALGPLRAGGRPKLPDLDVRDAIHAAWVAIPANRAEREAYYELHQQFAEIPVATLHQVVHEHDSASPTARSTGRKAASTVPTEPTKVRV